MRIGCSIAATALVFGCVQSVIAAPAEHRQSVPANNQARMDAVKSAFQHAWQGYAKYAWGHDELRPLSNGYSDTRNGWGASIFDALDTMIIMGLDKEYQQAMDHVLKVDWKKTPSPSKTFETNIRYLGGLLSAYDLRPDPQLLNKALDLAHNVILPAYNTPNGIPAAYVDVAKGKPTSEQGLILAEFGSLQLELVRLSQVTGDDQYAKLANSVIEKIANVKASYPGLYPITWDLKSFTPSSELQLDMWKVAAQSMQQYLRSETSKNMVFLSEINDQYKLLQTGELVCFIPGNLLMGARYLNDPNLEKFATELMDGCYNAWALTPTGLAPETWSWVDKSQDIKKYPQVMQAAMQNTGYAAQDVSYDLRPETLESIFYFYRLTGDPKYQDMAWNIFQAIEKYCKTESGYTRVADVSNTGAVRPMDFEESYFFAETLKYLYLTFADPNYISLDDYVLNTEAHPFKLTKPVKIQAQFS
ncbi:glycoside hydrolase [Syncephalastrum racemosum]|uniref:alpha-1,2-Mannosidase n=1 Tax=Syncephalastrum racemosum TaxID=13706 RepID=A0A1X2HRN7_SYNRA|nr:glycoside hydrolase [Syncephalastrum racemosum]